VCAKQLELLVLDEADRLLDMGFQIALSSILSHLPKQRRTGLFSATLLDQRIAELSRAGMRDAVNISVRVTQSTIGETSECKVPRSLQNFYIVLPNHQKLLHALQLLAKQNGKAIVYVLTCAYAELLAHLPLESMLRYLLHENRSYTNMKQLSERRVYVLHGKMGQSRRERTLGSFRDDPNGVLICTDVAARGLDIPDVSWVLQLDPPQHPEQFVHRVGRTARLGRDGHALLYLTPSEDAYVPFLHVQKCSVDQFDSDSFDTQTLKHAEHASVFQSKMKKAVIADRAVVELGERAFLSYLRAYKQHRCSYVLEFDKLDIGSLANALFLLRIPRIAEFRKLRSRIEFEKDPTVDLKAIKFKDKQRELLRQKKIADAVENPKRFSDTAQARKNRNRKLEKRENLKQKKRSQLLESLGVATKSKAGANADDFDHDDLDELAKDARRLKKRRNGKISEDSDLDFDSESGISKQLSDSNDNEVSSSDEGYLESGEKLVQESVVRELPTPRVQKQKRKKVVKRSRRALPLA